MKILKGRRAASVAVTVALVAVLAMTGVLCALDINNKITYNDTDIEVANTATTYSINGWSPNVNNTSTVFKQLQVSGANGDIRVVFPKAIYVDMSETLQSVGYFFLVDQWGASNGDRDAFTINESLFGVFKDSNGNAVDGSGNANAFRANFSNYNAPLQGLYNYHELASGYSEYYYKSDSAWANWVHKIVTNTKGTNLVTKYPMSGTPKAKVEGATFAPSGKIGFREWYGYQFGSSIKWRTLDGTEFEASALGTSSGTHNIGGNSSGLGWTVGSNIGGYVSSISIPITIYDKSALKTALEKMDADIDKITNAGVKTGGIMSVKLEAAKTLRDKAATYYRTRENSPAEGKSTIQDTINYYTNELNNFSFTLARPQENHSWTFGERTSDIKTLTGLDGIDASGGGIGGIMEVGYNYELADLYSNDVESKSGKIVNDNNANGTSTFTYASCKDIKNAGTYTISLKFNRLTGMNHGYGWASGDQYDVTITVTVDRAYMTALEPPAAITSSSLTGSDTSNGVPAYDANKDTWTRTWSGSAQTFRGRVKSVVSTLAGGMYRYDAEVKVSTTPSSWDSKKDRDLMWNDCTDEVTFTEVGTHTVYYRVTAPNHYGLCGSYQVTIGKAAVVIGAGAVSKTYGDGIAASADLISSVSSVTFNGNASSSVVSKSNLGDILTLGVKGSDGEFIADNLTGVGSYEINVSEYAAIDPSNVLDGVSGISTWADRLSVTLTNNTSAYTINKKDITLAWTYDTDTVYDGGAHAPSVSVSSGLVEDGEDFTPTAVVAAKAGGTPLKDNAAVWAGEYSASVANTTANYNITGATFDFAIGKRALAITVADQSADYAKTISGGDGDATAILNDYKTMFADNDNTNVFDITSGSLATGDAYGDIFTVEILGVTSSGAYYNAGTHSEALGIRLLTASENGDTYFVNSYEITVTKGDFAIEKAEIISDAASEIRLTYNGEDQEFALTPDTFTLQGYEQANKESEVVIEYATSLTGDGNWSTNPITLKNWAESGDSGFTVYFRVTADNHNSTGTLNFKAFIDKLNLQVNIGEQTQTKYYGDDIPNSDELIALLGITYTSTDGDGAETDYSIAGNLGFYLTKAGSIITDRTSGAGKYDVNIKSINTDVALTNFEITFDGTEAYEIAKRELVIYWRQNGWQDNGTSRVYNGNKPNVKPVIYQYRATDTNDAYGDNTSDDQQSGYVENYIDEEVILSAITLSGGTVGEYTAEIKQAESVYDNYVIVNPSAKFNIIQRQVSIVIKDQSVVYGNVSTAILGNLVANNNKMWSYKDGTPNQFLSTNYGFWKIDVAGLSDSTNVDADGYDITLSIDGDTQNVTSNYIVTVYREDADGNITETTANEVAKLYVTPATLKISQTVFDFDASPANPGDPSDNTVVEPCFINNTAIQALLKVVGGTEKSDVAVSMTDAQQTAFEGEPADGDIQNSSVSLGGEQLGTYYVWIKATNSNYEDLSLQIEINNFTNWISITLGNTLTANYGEATMTSDELFEYLVPTKITGVMGDDGSTHITNTADAWAKIEARGYFSLYVMGAKDGELLTVGHYSIGMNVSADPNVVGSGENMLHFRFKATEGQTQLSNVDVYEVIKRPIYVTWTGADAYTYGEGVEEIEHTIENLLAGDEASATFEFDVDNSNGTPGDLEKGTVGDYIARLIGVSLDNYRIAEIGDVIRNADGSSITITAEHLEFKFSITPREITVTIADKSLTYGEAYAQAGENINDYVNASGAYSISVGTLAEGDDDSDVFAIFVDHNFADGAYLAADTYDIDGRSSNGNYSVTFNKGELTVSPANFTITSMAFADAYFNATAQTPALSGTPTFSFAGDVTTYSNIYINNDKNATADSEGWVALANFAKTNAGTHEFAVMVEADNHNPSVRSDITFTIQKASVLISLTEISKTYGDALGEGDFAEVVSNYIKANAGVTYTVTSNGAVITVADIADAFNFYVVAGGSASTDGDASVEDGNYANSVGSYRIWHTFAGDAGNNYTVAYANGCNAGAYVITPKAVGAVWSDATGNITSGKHFTYSNAAVGLTAVFETVYFDTATGEMKKGTAALALTGDQEIAARANAYTATAAFDGAQPNYTLESAGSTFEYFIDKRDVTVEITAASNTYGATKAEMVAAFNGGSWALAADDQAWASDFGSDVTLTLALSAFADDDFVTAGYYDINATWNNSNYDVTFSGGEEGFTVNNAQMTYSPNATAYELFTYNGAAQTIDLTEVIGNSVWGDSGVTLVGDMNFSDATITYSADNGSTYTDTLPTITMGTETVYFKISVANHDDAIYTLQVKVKKAKIVILINQTEFEYGSTDLSSDELCAQLNIRVDTEQSSDFAVVLSEVFNFAVDTALNPIPVGKYAVTLSPKDNETNKFLTYSVDTSVVDTASTFVVIPKTVQVNWGSQELTYNGKEQAFDYVDFIGVAYNETLAKATCNLRSKSTVTACGKDVGDYEVEIALNTTDTVSANYVIDEDYTVRTFKIVPKEVEIEWNLENFVYDGQEHMLTATVKGGLCSDENDTEDSTGINYSAAVRTAGTHTASVVGLTNANYTVAASATAEFVIAQAEVEIAWVAGTYKYNALEQRPEAYVKADSLFSGDACEVVVTGGGVDAGTHTAVAVSLTNANYKLPASGVEYEFAIAALELTNITWSNTSLEYVEVGGVAKAQTPTATGIGTLPGDSVTLDISVTGGEGRTVGEYTATVVGVSNNTNYVIGSGTTNKSVTFNITKAANKFDKDLVLPETDGGLPALADFETVASKYGNATIKYYVDEALTQEYTGSLDEATKGTYYVVVSVDGTENYEALTKTFTVEVKGESNGGLIAGIVVGVLALIAVATVLAIVIVKKKKKDDATPVEE